MRQVVVCTGPGIVDGQIRLVCGEVSRPDGHEVELAARAVRVHCVTRTPGGEFCLNCGWSFPCVTHRWGREVLTAAGWNDGEIAGLDRRTGAWS